MRVRDLIILILTESASAMATRHTCSPVQTGVMNMQLFGAPTLIWSGQIPIDGCWHTVNTNNQSVSRVQATWNGVSGNFSCNFYPESIVGDFHCGNGTHFNLGPPKAISHVLCRHLDNMTCA